MVKRGGPSTDSWVTPLLTGSGAELESFRVMSEVVVVKPGEYPGDKSF